MIQRKQTIFLILAFLVIMGCQCVPIAYFFPEGMGVDTEMYNCVLIDPLARLRYTCWPLSLILVLAATVTFIDIFLYKKRSLQAKLCWVIVGLLVVWYPTYYYYANTLAETYKCQLEYSWSACLPALAIIFTLLARNGIIADEKLVRSMDRIR